MNSRVVAIVQARMGSKRFPKKMLTPIGDFALLEWVLLRLSRSKNLHDIVLATTVNKGDDILVRLARKLGVKAYRGSESDVLERFLGAADEAKATSIVRICADNPFIDSIEVDKLIDFFNREPCDYAFNHQNRLGSGYADGFGAEIFTLEQLKKIDHLAKYASHREHVTSYFWDHQTDYLIKAIPAPVELAYPQLCFDIDTLGDLLRINALIADGVNIETSAADIIKIKLKNSL